MPMAKRSAGVLGGAVDVWPQLTPEQRLLSAILEDALTVYRHPRLCGRRNRTLLRDTEAWFASTNPRCAFSFQYICDALGLDANAIRSALWRERSAGRLVA